MDRSESLPNWFGIVINFDFVLDYRLVYARNFFIIPRKHISEFLEKGCEACNFLWIAIGSNLNISTIPILIEISMSIVLEILLSPYINSVVPYYVSVAPLIFIFAPVTPILLLLCPYIIIVRSARITLWPH